MWSHDVSYSSAWRPFSNTLCHTSHVPLPCDVGSLLRVRLVACMLSLVGLGIMLLLLLLSHMHIHVTFAIWLKQRVEKASDGPCWDRPCEVRALEGARRRGGCIVRRNVAAI